MWTVRRDNPGAVATLRLQFYAGEECLTYADFLNALAEQSIFRDLVQEEMQGAPFTAFRWETPPLTDTNWMTFRSIIGTWQYPNNSRHSIDTSYTQGAAYQWLQTNLARQLF